MTRGLERLAQTHAKAVWVSHREIFQARVEWSRNGGEGRGAEAKSTPLPLVLSMVSASALIWTLQMVLVVFQDGTRQGFGLTQGTKDDQVG